MHTGYDNFWMYQNNRPEPVLSLPRNDNFSNAVLTDSYKQVLNGGGPNHLSSCVPQNSVARSHHSDQFRMTSSQYGWPSSVYSLPFRSSYANNFCSQEAYSNHSSSLRYSSQNSQIYQNYDSRYLRNSNFPYVNNITNSDNCNNTAKAQNNPNTNAAVGRIRVKDVFSLNNNSLCDSNLFQSNQIEKQECSLNNAGVMSYFTTCQTKTSSKCADYEKNNLHESNNSTSTYECAEVQQSLSRDHQQYLQHSGSFYQQKNPSLPPDAFQTNPLTGQFYNQQKIQRRASNNRRNSNEVLHDSKRIKIQPRRNSTGPTAVNNSEAGPCVSTEKSDVFFSGSVSAEEKLMRNTSNAIEVACSQSDLHENLAKLAEVNSFKNNPSVGKLRKWRKNQESVFSVASSPSQNQMNGQEKSMIKITYPHSGQSSFLFIEDSDGSGSNSNLSLPCLLEPDSQLMNNFLTNETPIHAEINAQENVVDNLPADQVMQENENRALINAPNITQSNDSHPSSLNSSPRASKLNIQNLQKKEPVFRDQENSNPFLNSDAPPLETPENFFQDKKISIKANLCNEVNSLTIKQEASGTENPNGECVLEHQIFHQIIKTEENPEDPFLSADKLDCLESENLNPLKKVPRLDLDNNENIDVNSADEAKGLSSSKKIGSNPKTMSSALKNADNRIKEQDDLKNSSKKEKKKCSAKKKQDKGSVARKKVCTPHTNYKSEINRDKLDLLIEFLNKEEDAVDLSRVNETNCTLSLKDDDNDKMKKDVESNRNRRKLSKTCIVKNKNNSREMVSLISHKVARVEVLKCSPVPPQAVETNKKLDQSEEKKTSSGVLSDNHSETDIPFQTVRTQKDLLEYENNANVSEGKDCQNPSEESSSIKEKEIQEEENIINTMRAFQTLKTHFCMSCNLNSGISSFWINVVSGELRCLNCFKKMLKTEDNVLRLKAEGVDCKNDSEGSVTQKDKKNETVENEDKNKTKTRAESDQISTPHFAESHHGRKNSQDVKENIKQEVTEKIIESAKDKIVDQSNEKQSLITKSSNPTKRSVSMDDSALLGKIAEEQKNCKMMELKNSKLKENSVKGCLGQDIKELQSRLKRESFTKEDKCTDKAFGLEHKTSPVKLKENCSAGEGMPWNSPNPLEGKDALKKGSVGPMFNGLENCKEELLSDGSKRKITSKDVHISVENLKHVSGECKNQEITDKSEKSCKRNTPKQEGGSETLKKLSRSCQDQVRKSRNSKDEFICQKAHIWEERKIKEVKLIESDKSVAKQSTIESCSCRKTTCLENGAKKNCRHEPSERLNVPSPLKETLKSAPASNSLEKHKKIESQELTKKRKNSEDGFVSYKIRAVEDPSKVEIKPASHVDRTKATTKECSSCCKNKSSEQKKVYLIDITEKTKKNSVSKNESKQSRVAVDKCKTKSDHSEHLKHKGNDDWSEVSRGKSQKECLSSTKQHSQNEIKNNAGSENKLKSCASKEGLSFPKAHAFKSFSREIQNGNVFSKVKEWEKTEEKERKYFCGKIPKKCFPSTDRNLAPGLRSPLNYKLEEKSHVLAKKDHYNRIVSPNPNRKFTKESFNKGKICRKKEEEKCEANNNNKRVKEVFRNEGSVKSKKELEECFNQRKGTKNQANDFNKGKAVNYFGDRKEVSAEKAESDSLMARLIQKTKKLSWSLLKEP